MAKDKFYITTSIAYTNAPPHLGFALEAVQADVLARYSRLLKKETFFLTGTDEHGRKVQEAADKAGQTPQEFCDGVSARFQGLKLALNLSNDSFIRTTDRERHWPAVKKAWFGLEKTGDIYKKKYQGLYCSGCEAFITKKDLVEGKCALHQREPEVVEEENWFFRLSKYSKDIEKLITKDQIKIIPESRKKEMLNFIKQGLEDVSFSRPRKDLQWGIPVPSDATQTIYCWADALTNYLSAIGYADDPKTFKKYWPVDVHCIGKDIQKFHLAIWPGMLLSLGLPLPRNILVHGFITADGQKMSKSLGNVVDPYELVKKYGTDAVRYFLLREISPTEDGDFTPEKFEKRYNSDLASGLGNLVSRVLKMVENSGINSVPKSFSNSDFKKKLSSTEKMNKESLADFKFNEALITIWGLITFCDQYINQEKPWEESPKQKEVIGDLLLSLQKIAELLSPFLPETSQKIERAIKANKIEALFPRI